MSVLIKGMGMPKSCWECRLTNRIYCYALPDFEDDYVTGHTDDRLANCPLVPVPPHGDCIDRDALKVAICSRLCIKSEKYLSPEEATIVNEIFAAPTIIPAEEGET